VWARSSEIMYLLYLFLNVPPVSPVYVSSVCVSVLTTVAWYTSWSVFHCPSRGKVSVPPGTSACLAIIALCLDMAFVCRRPLECFCCRFCLNCGEWETGVNYSEDLSPKLVDTLAEKVGWTRLCCDPGFSFFLNLKIAPRGPGLESLYFCELGLGRNPYIFVN
jgi:hypothetical protein